MFLPTQPSAIYVSLLFPSGCKFSNLGGILTLMILLCGIFTVNTAYEKSYKKAVSSNLGHQQWNSPQSKSLRKAIWDEGVDLLVALFTVVNFVQYGQRNMSPFKSKIWRGEEEEDKNTSFQDTQAKFCPHRQKLMSISFSGEKKTNHTTFNPILTKVIP